MTQKNSGRGSPESHQSDSQTECRAKQTPAPVEAARSTRCVVCRWRAKRTWGQYDWNALVPDFDTDPNASFSAFRSLAKLDRISSEPVRLRFSARTTLSCARHEADEGRPILLQPKSLFFQLLSFFVGLVPFLEPRVLLDCSNKLVGLDGQ